MKLKQLSTEFEYCTPEWHIFGLIQLRIIAYSISLFSIWTTTVQNFIPMYQQIRILQIFSHLSRFFHRILTILPNKIAILGPIQLGIIANIVS